MANKLVVVFDKVTAMDNLKNPDNIQILFIKSMWGLEAPSSFVSPCLKLKIDILPI